MGRNDFFPYHLNGDAIIIDIRTMSEILHTGMIENSHHIDFSNEISLFKSKLIHIIKTKHTQFYLICTSGSRSNMMTTQLVSDGYDCFNIIGGIIGVIKDNKIKLIKK